MRKEVIMNWLHKLGNWMLDMLFPPRCISCNEVGRPYICDLCIMGIQINKDFRCINCGYKTDLGNTCLNCSEINAIDQLLVATDYNEPLIKKAIRYYKYNFIQELASPLSDIIIKYLKWLSRDRGFEIFDEDTIITAVPLVRRRRNWRGFNQSELIASRIADNFLINYDFNLFVRANGARSQAGIENRERRMANTIGRINITQGSRVHGRRVIVIDDVSTTGSTLNACATVLKDAGAKEVIGLVVARG